MNQEPTAFDAQPQATTTTADTGKKRRLRRHSDLNLGSGFSPAYLLAHEDPAELKALRQSIRDQLGAQSAFDLILADLATANAWRSLRASRLLSASMDIELVEQTGAFGLAPVLSEFVRTIRQCDQNLRRILAMRAGKTNG